MEKFSSKELRFSDRAISHFSTSLSNNGEGDGIRIGVRKAGCSGFEYFFEFVDAKEKRMELEASSSFLPRALRT